MENARKGIKRDVINSYVCKKTVHIVALCSVRFMIVDSFLNKF